ncbi:MAG: HAD hydrolase-like protein [Pseudomonadota bacterium]
MSTAPRPYDLLIFDWDGTLADSIGQIVRSMQIAIAELGWEPRTDLEIGQLIGLGLSDGLHQLYPGISQSQVNELLGCFRKLWLTLGTGQAEAPLFAGAEDALHGLFDAGHVLTVATGKSRAGLDRALVWHRSVRGLFMASRTADETANKPNPLMLLQLLGELKTPAARALMIGDTEYDSAMAAAIGMDSVGVATGVHTAARIQKAGALTVLASVRELPSWLASRSRVC